MIENLSMSILFRRGLDPIHVADAIEPLRMIYFSMVYLSPVLWRLLLCSSLLFVDIRLLQPHLVVKSALPQEAFVCALFCNLSLVEDDDQVCINHSA